MKEKNGGGRNRRREAGESRKVSRDGEDPEPSVKRPRQERT